ncbi:hypothetical protein [Actinomyces sp.]|uniref:hypothetical protein n=1 Tax=Actinomyces sp. TaxID=29317 RepID=UPI0026DC96E6|nr:hypothetical protein [Actinomyces sp.]MDO4900466.1 hypothetical protein [Actinomyces sp.]
MSDQPESPSTPDEAGKPNKRMAADDDTNPSAMGFPQETAKASRRRKVRIASFIAAVVLLIVLAVAFVHNPGRREADSLSGYVTGVTAAIFAFWLIGWWVRRRGGSSYSRALDGTEDERDELIWKSAWALTGRVDWFLFLGVLFLALLDVEVQLGTVAIIGIWVNLVALYGSRFYYERSM